jgi:integrase
MTSTGIRERHGHFEAWVYDRRAKKKIRKTFPTLSAAKAWRQDATVAVRKRTLKATSPTTVRQAWEAWLAGAKGGSIRTRSGDTYKPSVLRSYDSSMRLHVLDEFGALKLGDVSRLELQDLADRLLAAGLDPSTIRNALMPLRVVFRRAVSRGELAVNPATGLELPAVRGRRDRIASPEEAAKLIAAAPEDDRAIWTSAAYAGLRCGELQALEHDDLDLGAGVIHVRRSWDPREARSSRRVAPARATCRSPRPSARSWPLTCSARPVVVGSCSGGRRRPRSTRGSSPFVPSGPGRPPSSRRSACTSSGTLAPRSSSPPA